jgi:hypothetical protein
LPDPICACAAGCIISAAQQSAATIQRLVFMLFSSTA